MCCAVQQRWQDIPLTSIAGAIVCGATQNNEVAMRWHLGSCHSSWPPDQQVEAINAALQLRTRDDIYWGPYASQ